MSGSNKKVSCPLGEDLSRLADGASMPAERLREVQDHLRECEACRRTYDAFVRTHAMLKECLARSTRETDAGAGDHVGLEMLGAYLDGGPEPEERERIEAHMARCAKCLDDVVALDETVRQTGRATVPSTDEVREESARAVRAFIEKAAGGKQEAAPPAVLSYCLKCGNQVPSTSTFCPECGHALAAVEDPGSVWRDVAAWVRGRRMTYLSLMVAIAALFAASWHSYRKYQFYAIAMLATVKWLADMCVRCLVDALASAGPTEETDAARRRHEMVATVAAAVGKAAARHAWLLAASAVFGLSLIVKSHFAEFVVIGSVLAIKWILDESGARLALSLLRAWRSQDEKRIEQLVQQLRRRDRRRDAGKDSDRKVSGI